MLEIDPEVFTQDWLQCWNRHDIEGVLSHFHEEVIFSSPTAVKVLPESGGILHGKAQLRNYWTLALNLIPDLKFSLAGLYAGYNMLVINYINQKNISVNEVLIFDHGLVIQGYGTYPIGIKNPSGVADTSDIIDSQR